MSNAPVVSSTAKNIRSVLEWAINTKYGNNASYLSQVNFQPLPAKVDGAVGEADPEASSR